MQIEKKNEGQEQKPAVQLLIKIEIIGVQRHISFAAYSNTTRIFKVGNFKDNEHYSHLDSLILQFHPKEDEVRFLLHLALPQLKHQRKKIIQKADEVNYRVVEQRPPSIDIQSALGYLLKRTLNMYTKELEELSRRLALERLLQIIGLEREKSNKGQFDLKLVNLQSSMLLDSATVNSLQVFGKEIEKKMLSSNMTLYDILNNCKTSFGSRCLKRWMCQPLQQKQQIESRLDKVQYFINDSPLKSLIQNQLKKLPDLDRLYFIFYKVAAGKKINCQVSDLIKIYRAVETLQELLGHLQQKQISEPSLQKLLKELQQNVIIISKICKMIEKGIDMSGSKDSQFFVRPETQASLSVIMNRKIELEQSINQEVFEVAQYLGLQVEKVPSNTHLFVLEANKKNSINKVKQAPDFKFLTAKQTKITFVTSNLSRLCEQLRQVDKQYKAEQQVILRKMFELVAGYYPVMEQMSIILSQLDILSGFASLILTANQQWSRPRITGKGIQGVRMRHPCLKDCIPNDCDLNQERTIVLTGPNMGGKSTYIRTIGICAYLAHLGAYVPAAQFCTPIVDAIITRVGASDMQVKGISTFMSEMLESACMIEAATESSLVLIDQLGRGTSTCQGFGVAWAICQYMHKQIRAQCLFATHFHEMTRLAQEVKGVKNMFTRCRIENGELVLEYRVQEGKMMKSYGVEVMKMLKFPEQVVKVAENYLKCYEEEGQKDEQLKQLSEQAKNQIYNIACEMQQCLSKHQEDEHQKIQELYKKRIRAVVEANKND